MCGLIPRIHARHYRVTLVNHQHRAFGDGVEVRIGDDDRDFDNAVGLGNEPGHFHIYPDEIILILCHMRLKMSRKM